MTETCPICGEDSHKIISERMRDADKKVFHCEACDIAFKQGFAQDALDAVSETQRGTARFGLSKKTIEEIYETGLRNQEVNLDVIYGHIKPVVRASEVTGSPHLPVPRKNPDLWCGNVLEIGCSSGYFLSCISEHASSIYGVDLDSDSIEYAKTKHKNGNYFSGNLSDSQFPKHYFDIIFAFQVLEHQANPKAFIDELSEYLRPGGQICLSVPNLYDALYSVCDIPCFETFAFIDEHLLYFSEKSLGTLLSNCGFSGEVIHRQLFTINNAFSWLFTDKPMLRFEDAINSEMRFKNNVSTAVKTEINTFLTEVNREYKNLLERLGLSTSLYYVGTLKKE